MHSRVLKTSIRILGHLANRYERKCQTFRFFTGMLFHPGSPQHPLPWLPQSFGSPKHFRNEQPLLTLPALLVFFLFIESCTKKKCRTLPKYALISRSRDYPNTLPLTLVFQQRLQEGLEGAQQSSDYCISCLASSSGGMENKIAVQTSDLYTSKDSPSIPILHPSKGSVLAETILLISGQYLACLGKDTYTKHEYHAVSIKSDNQTLCVTSFPSETVDWTLHTLSLWNNFT